MALLRALIDPPWVDTTPLGEAGPQTKAPEVPAHPDEDLGSPGHSHAREKPTRSTGLRPGSLLGKRPGAPPSIYPPKPY